MKIFTKLFWTEVPLCKKCGGTGKLEEKSVKVWWKGKLIDACPKCRGRGRQAI